MRIKGVPSLFWVQHDAFDKMERRLRHEYGISIYERGDFSGYIKKNVRYQVRFPILEDGSGIFRGLLQINAQKGVH